MGWTTPVTHVAGDQLAVADWNALAGDVSYLGGGGSGNKPMFRVQQTVAQSIATGTAGATVAYDTVLEDTASGWVSASNWYAVPSAGLWLVSTYMIFASNATGTRSVRLQSPAGTVIFDSAQVSAPVDSYGRTIATWFVRVSAGATLNISANQTSGAALNTAPGISGTGPIVFFGVLLSF